MVQTSEFTIWLCFGSGTQKKKGSHSKNFKVGISHTCWGGISCKCLYFSKLNMDSLQMFLIILSHISDMWIFLFLPFLHWVFIFSCTLFFGVYCSEHVLINGYKCLFSIKGFSRTRFHSGFPPISLVRGKAFISSFCLKCTIHTIPIISLCTTGKNTKSLCTWKSGKRGNHS